MSYGNMKAIAGAVEDPIRVSPEERHEMVAVAAYYRAERRGFAPGGAEQDWLAAERDIDRLLADMAARGTSRAQFQRTGLRNALHLQWDRDGCDPA